MFTTNWLYGREFSLVGGLPSPLSHLLPSVYMKKLSLLTQPKLGPLDSKYWREVFLKHLLWLLFQKSETLNHRPTPFFGLIYRRLRFQFTCNFVFADCSVCACSVCVNLSLVGEAKITKLFIWQKVGSLPRVTLSSKRVTIHPRLPCPPSQLCNFSCKRFAAIYKETYEKLSRPRWLGWRVTLLPGTTLLHINRPQASLSKCTLENYIINVFPKQQS